MQISFEVKVEGMEQFEKQAADFIASLVGQPINDDMMSWASFSLMQTARDTLSIRVKTTDGHLFKVDSLVPMLESAFDAELKRVARK